MKLRRIASLFGQAASAWSDDSASSRAAALSYYTTLSLAPLLIVAIAIAGFAFGADEVRGQVINQIRGLVGTSGAEVIDSMLKSAHTTSTGIVATVVGVITLFLGSCGVFVELEEALNKFWGAPPRKGSSVVSFVRTRVLSFAMVLGIGFLLLVSLLLSTAIAA